MCLLSDKTCSKVFRIVADCGGEESRAAVTLVLRLCAGVFQPPTAQMDKYIGQSFFTSWLLQLFPLCPQGFSLRCLSRGGEEEECMCRAGNALLGAGPVLTGL